MPKEPLKSIESLRKKIDSIDYKIIKLLGERFRVSYFIQKYKKARRIAVIQKDREISHLKSLLKIASSEGLPKRMIELIYKRIFSHSRRVK